MVEFVRKRDKRVAENRKKLSAKAEENKKKTQLLRKQQIEARNKELENYRESDWTSMSALEENLKEIEEQLDKEHENGSKATNNSDSEDEEEDNLYCIACDKAFKSDKAFANHENSKKHKSNVASLRQQLQNDDQLIKDDSQDES